MSIPTRDRMEPQTATDLSFPERNGTSSNLSELARVSLVSTVRNESPAKKVATVHPTLLIKPVRHAENNVDSDDEVKIIKEVINVTNTESAERFFLEEQGNVNPVLEIKHSLGYPENVLQIIRRSSGFRKSSSFSQNGIALLRSANSDRLVNRTEDSEFKPKSENNFVEIASNDPCDELVGQNLFVPRDNKEAESLTSVSSTIPHDVTRDKFCSENAVNIQTGEFSDSADKRDIDFKNLPSSAATVLNISIDTGDDVTYDKLRNENVVNIQIGEFGDSNDKRDIDFKNPPSPATTISNISIDPGDDVIRDERLNKSPDISQDEECDDLDDNHDMDFSNPPSPVATTSNISNDPRNDINSDKFLNENQIVGQAEGFGDLDNNRNIPPPAATLSNMDIQTPPVVSDNMSPIKQERKDYDESATNDDNFSQCPTLTPQTEVQIPLISDQCPTLIPQISVVKSLFTFSNNEDPLSDETTVTEVDKNLAICSPIKRTDILRFHKNKESIFKFKPKDTRKMTFMLMKLFKQDF